MHKIRYVLNETLRLFRLRHASNIGPWKFGWHTTVGDLDLEDKALCDCNRKNLLFFI